MSHMSVGVPEGTIIEAVAECTCLWVVVPKQKNGIWHTWYKLERQMLSSAKNLNGYGT